MQRPFRGKVLLIRRKYVVAVALVLSVIAIFYIINHPAVVGVSGRERVLPIYSVYRDDQAISLTFNVTDPADTTILQIMETLNAYDVRASFFVTGQWIRQNEAVALRLTEHGHELGNLSDDHSFLRQQSTSAMRENIAACNATIEAITGARPAIFRAPYGGYDDNLVTLARSLGLHTVQWSIDSGDWRGLNAETIARQVQRGAFPGGIVLLHANLEQTALALPGIIEGLQEKGYDLIPLSELVHQTAYTISLTGRQIPA